MGALSKLIRTVLLVLVALPPSAGLAQQSASPKRVLTLHWYDRGYADDFKLDRELHAALESSAPGRVEYYSEYLDTNQFPEENQELILCDYLRRKYAGVAIDVLIAITNPPLDFLLKYRGELFPHTPIVFTIAAAARARRMPEAGATGIVTANTFRDTVDLALKLHPGTKQLFVISGTLNHDKSRESAARTELKGFEDKVVITYLTDLSVEELIRKLKDPPKNSIALYVWQQVLNREGSVLESGDVFSRIAREAMVPLYGMSPLNIGLGMTGGYVWTLEADGTKLAEIAQRVANGERPEDIPIENAPQTPMFDWRQLQRWGIREERLPPGSVIQFREPTVWQQYKWRIVAALVIFVLQSSLIGALLFERRRARLRAVALILAQQEVRESEGRFRNMADTAPVMIWVTGSDKGFTFLNKTWLDFTGRTLQQELGNGWAEGVHPEDRDRCVASFCSSFNARQDFQIECRLRRADGEYRWVLSTGVPRFARGDVFAGYIGSGIDITDQKRAEATLRQSLDEIAHLNRVAAMGELTASMAHELNQPLAAILLNSQAASRFLSGQLPDFARVRSCLNAIAADGERAGEVIRRLRALLKKGESQTSLVDLNEVVNDALRLVANNALLRQVSVKFKPLPVLPPVLGDRIQLSQVVLNLMVNGLEAAAEMPSGSRWVLAQTTEADAGVELTVEDSGKGIRQSNLIQVFEPFFSTKPEGLGMGLSISRTIVQAHGGRIWAENRASGGAVFRCVLPVAKQTTAAAAR